MRIYVAGKNIERARSVMTDLQNSGHQITFDWLDDIENEKDPAGKAELERKGVQEADVLVYLWEQDQESARYEAGMAMGLQKSVIVSGNHNSFFFALSEVISVPADDQIVSALEGLA